MKDIADYEAVEFEDGTFSVRQKGAGCQYILGRYGTLEQAIHAFKTVTAAYTIKATHEIE